MDAAAVRRILRLCILCLATPSAWAVQEIVGLDNLDLGFWTPASGNLNTADDFCVASRLGNSPRPGRYAVRVTPLTGARFELRGIASPGTVIPLALSFQDLTDNGLEELAPATFTVREQAGVRTCGGTNNARLIARVLSADIHAAAPGEYQGVFRFLGQGIPSKTESSRDFSVRLRLTGMIRISGLDPIDLGAFDGVRDRQGVDDFCVYSNEANGQYTVTGTGQSTGGAYAVSSGADTLPFDLEYDDGTGLAAMEPGVPTQKSNADSQSIDCIGGNNANIRVTIRAADMQRAPSGIYSGAITLVVAPI